jgi:hypothetical protein
MLRAPCCCCCCCCCCCYGAQFPTNWLPALGPDNHSSSRLPVVSSARYPLSQPPSSEQRPSAGEKMTGVLRSKDGEFYEIEGHPFVCRCKKFPGTRTKSPTTHTQTHTLLAHSPITQQTGQTNKHGPRPLPTRQQSQLVGLSDQTFSNPDDILRVGLGAGECMAAAHMRWCCCILVLPYLRHSSWSHDAPLRSAGFALFDNAIHRGAFALQTCS